MSRTLAKYCLEVIRFEDALDAYSKGLQLDPQTKRLLVNRSSAHCKLGRFEDALKDCDSALSIEPACSLALKSTAPHVHACSRSVILKSSND